MRDYISTKLDIVCGRGGGHVGFTILVMEGIIPWHFDLKHVPIIIKFNLSFIRTIDSN